jgi:hypothetical protein
MASDFFREDSIVAGKGKTSSKSPKMGLDVKHYIN